MSQFNESQHRRDPKGQFASKGPAAEDASVQLDDPAEAEYLDQQANSGLALIQQDLSYTEMDRATEEGREEQDISQMEFDPESAQKFKAEMAEFREKNRADWDAYEKEVAPRGETVGAAYAMARIGHEGFTSSDHDLNTRLVKARWDQRDLSVDVGDNGTIILE